MAQPAQVAVEEGAQVGDAVFQHRDPVDAHAEGEALPLGGIDAAITAFQGAMDYLGTGLDVTLFTASDFGRTFAINGDGTDHGWGGHHFVVGGAARGGQIFGTPPEVGFDHALDAGRGRLIPEISVDQYAASLGRWFGLSDGELNAALPNLSNFGPPPELVG